MVWPLCKLVWMVVALAAMILLAPMAASAHEGHHPGADVQRLALHGPAVERTHGADSAEPSAEAAVSAVAWAPNSADGFCVDGCCAGMACCAVAIFAGAPRLDPPVLSASQTSPRAPPRLAGVRPKYHLEPPNALT